MNLFIAESSTAVGGQELAVLLHAEGLLQRGHRLRLLLEPGSPIAAMAEAKKLPVTLMSMRRSRYPLAILKLRSLLQRERPDILQVNSSRDSWIGSIAARLVRPRPRVLRIRHISAPLNRNATTQLLYRKLVDMVVVTGGEKTRRELIERDGLAADRVAIYDRMHDNLVRMQSDITAALPGLQHGRAPSSRDALRVLPTVLRRSFRLSRFLWSWSWPAFLGGFVWFFYRKMYLIGALLFLAPIVVGLLLGGASSDRLDDGLRLLGQAIVCDCWGKNDPEGRHLGAHRSRT